MVTASLYLRNTLSTWTWTLNLPTCVYSLASFSDRSRHLLPLEWRDTTAASGGAPKSLVRNRRHSEPPLGRKPTFYSSIWTGLRRFQGRREGVTAGNTRLSLQEDPGFLGGGVLAAWQDGVRDVPLDLMNLRGGPQALREGGEALDAT